MREITIKKNPTTIINSSRPFISKSDKEYFFSQYQASQKPFFSPLSIQAKLTVGRSDDKYEKEADNIADKVMGMSEKSIQQTRAACEKEESIKTKPLTRKPRESNLASRTLSSKISASNSEGFRLPDNTKQFMSSTLGHDFSNVKIHIDRKAIHMNQELNARAFTYGSDIYFNEGEYSPESSKGKRLLAHELTHVVQQQGPDIKRKVVDSDFFVTCRNQRKNAVEDLVKAEGEAINTLMMSAGIVQFFESNYTLLKNTSAALWFKNILNRCFHLDYDNFYVRKLFLPLLALRYRLVAGRIVNLNHRYICGPEGVEPPGECTTRPDEGVAWTANGLNQTQLCEDFWESKPHEKSLTILHEWFHFLLDMGDCEQVNTMNVGCYEKFAGEITGIVPSSYFDFCCKPPSV